MAEVTQLINERAGTRIAKLEIRLPAVSFFFPLVLVLSALVGFHAFAPRPHPPGMCQEPVRLTQSELTQPNWPQALYLQRSECHVTPLETYAVCRDTCDVQVYPTMSAKFVKLRNKQNLQVNV